MYRLVMSALIAVALAFSPLAMASARGASMAHATASMPAGHCDEAGQQPDDHKMPGAGCTAACSALCASATVLAAPLRIATRPAPAGQPRGPREARAEHEPPPPRSPALT